MTTLYRLAGLLLLLGLAKLTSGCATARHDAQAPAKARHAYHQAQRHHTRARHRAVPLYLPWN